MKTRMSIYLFSISKHLFHFIAGLFILLFATFIYSCDAYNKETANGYKYKVNKAGNGQKVSYGNYVYTWFSISTGDSVIFTSKEKDGKQVLLQDPNKKTAKIKDPVLDILPLLNIGDSVTVIVEVDDLMRLTDDLKDVKQLYYTVVVKSIESIEERKKAQKALNAKRNAARKKTLQRRSEEMQEHPEGGVAYQQLRTSIANYTIDARLQKSASGLEYIIYNKGSESLCTVDDEIDVHYIGMQEESLVFDETYSSNEVFRFVLGRGRVIKAWDEGIQMLGKNGEAFFKVPPVLGYGATGYGPLIKPNATLYFYVKVTEKK